MVLQQKLFEIIKIHQTRLNLFYQSFNSYFLPIQEIHKNCDFTLKYLFCHIVIKTNSNSCGLDRKALVIKQTQET